VNVRELVDKIEELNRSLIIELEKACESVTIEADMNAVFAISAKIQYVSQVLAAGHEYAARRLRFAAEKVEDDEKARADATKEKK